MSDQFGYYLGLLVSAFGFDGTAGNSILGWFVVALSVAVVAYSFYFFVSKSIWPGELDHSHIKYRVLQEEEEADAH